jgi:hypothetical protein
MSIALVLDGGAKISALETFQDGAYFTHVVAVQPAAGLLDPRVVSP